MAYVRSEASKARGRERRKQWYNDNKARKNAADKEWAAKNPERRREIVRRYKARNKDKLQAAQRVYKRQRYAEDPAVRKAHSEKGKAWRAKNREAIRVKKLLDNYGISLETYQALLARSDGRCEVCRKPQQGPRAKHLFIDHDHETGEIRGLLCHHCNMGLGCFRDSQELMQSAIQYLCRPAGLIMQHGHNVGAV
jgi:hypothetical protein